MARRRKPTGSPGYIPPKERREAVNKAADKQLDRFIKDKYESTKNQEAGVASIVQDMPKKFADEFTNSKGEVGPELDKNGNPIKSRYYRADGSLNSAGLATLSQYTDERPEYSRQLNRFVNSSPQLKAAYARRAPLANFAMNVAPRFIPVVGPAFAADQAAKNKKMVQNYLNRPESDYNKFVEYFKPQMNNEQIANTEIIEGEQKPLISPADMNLQKAKSFVSPADMNLQEATPFRSPQDMGFLDDENIFDTEKAAIDAALTPGNVFNPVAADKQSKVDFINQVENTNLTVEDAEKTFASYGQTIDEVFERSKQKQGGIIREEVNRDLSVDDTDPIPGGQFDLTRPVVNENTVPVIVGGAGPDYDYGDFMVNEDLGNVIPTNNMFPEGGVSGTPVTQAGQELVFSDGTPVTQPVDTGLNTPAGQAAYDILNSNATNDVNRSFVPDYNQSMLYQDLISGSNPTTDLMMQNPNLSYSDINDLAGGLSGGASSGTPDFGYFADGGSTNKYQNMSTHEKLMRMAAKMYG
jgi:hypothetical protein